MRDCLGWMNDRAKSYDIQVHNQLYLVLVIKLILLQVQEIRPTVFMNFLLYVNAQLTPYL